MPHEATADRIIKALGLEPLPGEGGFFRPTWRNRTASAIYFLLTREDFSALHRLDRDEVWHFYWGDPVEHWQFDPSNGAVRRVRLGPNVLAGEQPQLPVPAGLWQGARLDAPAAGDKGFALLGCTVSPAWDEKDFTLGEREVLARSFPAHHDLIRQLTR